MKPNVYDVGQGMTLSAVTTDRFKTGLLTASISAHADVSLSPQYSLLLAILSRGTQSDPTLRDLNHRMDMLYDLMRYTRNSRMGGLQILGGGISFIDPSYLPPSEDREHIEDENVRVLLESIYQPIYDENGNLLADYTEKEKREMCDLIRDERNSKSAYAKNRSRELTFAGTPYAVSFSGTVEAVEAMTHTGLTSCYRSFFPHAPVRFFYVGSSEGERVAERIMRITAAGTADAVTDGTLAEARPLPLSRTAVDVPLRFEETLPLSQARLEMYFDTGVDVRSADHYTAKVYEYIFGGSPVSKLFVNVREKKSLCYHCASSLNTYAGYMRVSAGISCENREETEAEILLQIEAMRRGEFSVSDVEAAKRNLDSIYEGLYDSAASIEQYFFARELYGVSSTPEESRANIARVTREDVVRFAQGVTLRSVYFLRGTKSSDETLFEEDAE